MPGLVNDLPIKDLLALGYREVYNFPYAHTTLLAEIQAIRAQCDSATIMCVGGSKPDEGTLRLVSCGNCLNITSTTQQNQARFNGAAYWYFAPNLSFGFAPNATITQGQADTTDLESTLRLSWHLDLATGGWRLGNINGLNSNSVYYKKVYLKALSN